MDSEKIPPEALAVILAVGLVIFGVAVYFYLALTVFNNDNGDWK